MVRAVVLKNLRANNGNRTSGPRSPEQVDRLRHLSHSLSMRLTNLELDEKILEEALRLSGERTYSAAVRRALTEFVRRAKAGRILELQDRGLWEGDLSEMRRDTNRDA